MSPFVSCRVASVECLAEINTIAVILAEISMGKAASRHGLTHAMSEYHNSGVNCCWGDLVVGDGGPSTLPPIPRISYATTAIIAATTSAKNTTAGLLGAYGSYGCRLTYLTYLLFLCLS